ncbi:DMT family transporter [Halonatronum saccharophilum]|uniref:DMT family transporter n=1 Tax=Halonatronum saccharophilum TaxID=150060 RepID=UPI0004860396|nr:DMT family transporter [Halonatronum saccharophilum]
MGSILIYLIAAISGAAMALQGALNSVLGKVVGELESTFIVHIIATLVVALVLFIFNLGKGDLGEALSAPWYSYLGGILNVLILYGVIFSMPRLGVANATTIIITAQILTAITIDHLGVWGLEKVGFQWVQLVGLIFLSIGVKLLFLR